jgi:signal transduction histidine kinase/ActR/RegA family two-component response regulator
MNPLNLNRHQDGYASNSFQAPTGMLTILSVEIRFEQDVVLARQRARQIASQLGFDQQEQTRIATAISEIARNALNYAGGGKAEFCLAGRSPQVFLMRISDSGPGIADLAAILEGRYQSPTGLGLGLISARRLMDEMQIQSVDDALGGAKQGTIVDLIKYLPKHISPLKPPQIRHIVDYLVRETPENPYAEIQQQNQELLHTLEELRLRQEELAQLNQELEYTNRGVLALYAELNDRAESFQKASELKSRFLSHLSHEFRTPLNGILGLSDLLLRHLDGDLGVEQEKQVRLMRQSAASLSDLVDDLLDLAKVESGKVEVHVAPFQVADLFSTLLGMLRPLLNQNEAVTLIFDDTISTPSTDDRISEATAPPTLETDEGKVSQILRNLVSNALKFTEHGEVRVSAALGTHETIIFTVSDTGIGIAAKHQAQIFEEFVQIDNPLQRRVKGTGLGLSLCKKLTELLGGSIRLESTPNVGSNFYVTLPISYSDVIPETLDSLDSNTSASHQLDNQRFDHSADLQELESDSVEHRAMLNDLESNDQNQRAPLVKKILLIDDAEVFRYTLGNSLTEFSCTVIEAKDGYEGIYRARTEQPDTIVLDLFMPGIDGFEVLTHLKSDPVTRSIPVIILSSNDLTASESEYLATQTIALLSKQADTSHMLAQLQSALLQAGFQRESREDDC